MCWAPTLCWELGARRAWNEETRGYCAWLWLLAAIYASEIVLEYVLLPRDNTRYGEVEFGLVFLCYLAAGFNAALRTRRARDGAMTTVGAALSATLLSTSSCCPSPAP